jgi:hypothetical protein
MTIGDSHEKFCMSVDMYRIKVTFSDVSNFKCSDGLYEICTHKFDVYRAVHRNIFL